MKDLKWVPPSEWPQGDPNRFNVWRSPRFLVQAFREKDGMVRLTICRAQLKLGSGDWEDGISWDDLQALKSAVGYGNFDAVEVYPPDADIVNVSNLRHLWVLPKGQRLSFAWRSPGHQLSLLREQITHARGKGDADERG